MDNTLYDFLFDFILGGLIIALSSIFIRKNNTEFGGFIYGALPIGFIYLYVLTYYKSGLKESKNICYSVLVANIIFTIYILCVYTLNDYGISYSLLISLLIFLLLCYLYLNHIKA